MIKRIDEQKLLILKQQFFKTIFAAFLTFGRIAEHNIWGTAALEVIWMLL